MKSEKQQLWFCELITLFGYISILSALYWIFSRSETGEISDPGTPLWCVCAFVGFFALRIYLRKERALSQVSLFALVAFGVQAGVLIAFSPAISGFFGYAFAFFFWAIVAFQSYSFNVNGITLLQMTTMLEGCVALLILVMFYQTATGLSQVYVMPLLFAVLLSLFGLITMRTSGGERESGFSGFRGVMIITCILLLLGVFILAFLMFLYAPVGDAVIAVYQALVSSVLFILGIIEKVILFLISLLPEFGPGEMLAPESAGPAASMAEESMKSPAMLKILLIIIGVIGAIVLIGQMIRLRGIKVGGIAVHAGGRRIKRTGGGLLKMLLLLFARIKASLRFFVMTVLYRHTAPGLLVYLERWARLHKSPRLGGETHHAFLRRLSQEENRAMSGPLTELSDALDIRFYASSGGRDLSKQTVAAIRRGFKMHSGKSSI